MNGWRQVAAITALNVKNLSQRFGTSLVVVVGIGGVVAVLISVLAMSTGILRLVAHAGRADRVIVFTAGALSESSSVLDRDAVVAIANAPGLAHGPDGKAIISAEAMVLTPADRKSDGKSITVVVRGIGPLGSAVRPEIGVVEGRMFRPALRELIVGKAAREQFRGLAIGDHVALHDGDWTIVGVFAGGGGHDSEMLGDAETLLSAYQRTQFQSVTGVLASPADFQVFHDSVTANPALHVDVKRETEYLFEQSKPLRQLYTTIAYGVGGIMAVGALFGALNTMYSAVSARTREIATLRAIGFGSGAVIVSVFAEALLLALAGALIGAALSWALFNGNSISQGAAATGQFVYSLTVTPDLMLLGIIWAFVIGLVGGLFPALRAARLPIAAALRKG
jgi:putative ABC transport system permease protein